MAIVTGIGGTVTGAAYVSDVTEWSCSLSADAVDTTKLNSGGYRTKIPGIKSWSGSYTALVDSGTLGTVDNDIANGTLVSAEFKLSPATSKLIGSIVVTDIAISATLENAVEAVFTFEGSGTLTFENA